MRRAPDVLHVTHLCANPEECFLGQQEHMLVIAVQYYAPMYSWKQKGCHRERLPMACTSFIARGVR